MTECKVGDIVSVEFPFSDLQGQKRRPGLVLLADTSDVLLARLTTHPPRDIYDIALRDWAEAGLPKASTV
jgi:mRNA interferase MazF